MPSLELIPSDVFLDMDKIFNQEGSFSDVKFEIEGERPILCHKIMLRYGKMVSLPAYKTDSIRSQYFRKLFKSKKSEANDAKACKIVGGSLTSLDGRNFDK